LSKAGFCLKGKQWIEFMLAPPKNCPREHVDAFSPRYCSQCEYYERRKPTDYLLRKRKALQEAREIAETLR